MGTGEAITFGEGVALPTRIKFDMLPAHALPRSSTAKFSDKWQYSVGDEGFLDAVVERWRAAGIGGLDMTAQAHLLAEAVDIPIGGSVRRADALSSDPGMERTYGAEQAADADMYGGGHELSASATPLARRRSTGAEFARDRSQAQPAAGTACRAAAAGGDPVGAICRCG